MTGTNARVWVWVWRSKVLMLTTPLSDNEPKGRPPSARTGTVVVCVVRSATRPSFQVVMPSMQESPTAITRAIRLSLDLAASAEAVHRVTSTTDAHHHDKLTPSPPSKTLSPLGEKDYICAAAAAAASAGAVAMKKRKDEEAYEVFQIKETN
ncbi:hypothetical protein RUM44_004085 [Polyplax serrata]|uniref:Uncharacterized protein n=1 Tax=Polyplax serrata TaxID=468196 RepID=A0ABR1B279_POLSC